MYISLQLLQPLLALGAGLAALLLPRKLPYVVGGYLILVGLLGLAPQIG